jgi:tetratricopeptide (TPR) repeat protein
MSQTPLQKNTIERSTLDVKGNLSIGDTTYIINEREIKIPHLLTNNIPSNADHILGRDTELTTIINHLAQNKPTVLVNGIGGIGKTSVATKYVATYGQQYKHLAWLTVQSSVAEAFTNDLVLLKSLHIEQDVRQLIETQRLTDAFKLVIHKLNTLEHTLVVLDNANNPDDLIAHKNLFDTAKCHYLITSRTQPQEWTIVEIDHLPPYEAVNLFRKIAPSVLATDEDLKSLLSKLFYHTLLIELVAKAVENAGFSFAELQTMIETKFIHDEQLNEDIVSTGKHGDSVTDNRKRDKIEEYIWLIFSHVKDLDDDAKQILRGMALLPVATPFDRAFLKEHLALFEVKEIVPNLSLLVEWGWLEKEGNKWFKMHPLIADVVVKHLEVDVEFSELYIQNILKILDYDYANPKHNLLICNENKRFADRLIALFIEKNTRRISELLNKLGNLERFNGHYSNSIIFLERALKIAKSLFIENHVLIAESQYNLAEVLTCLERYDESIILVKQALEINELILGTEHPNTSDCLCCLASIFLRQKKCVEAEALLVRALKNDEKNFCTDHPRCGIIHTLLGDVYRKLGNIEQAIKHLEKAMTINRKHFSKDHLSFATDSWQGC